MNKYSLKDLNIIFNAKQYLPFDRFLHYFTLRFGYSDKDARKAYNVFCAFPKHISENEEMQNEFDKIIPLAIELVNDLQKAWELNSEFKNYSYERPELRKLIYIQSGETKEVVLNLHDVKDIITYAELLKFIRPIALLKYCCSVPIRNSKEYLDVFEGDIFDTNDLYFYPKSNVYVAEQNSTFKKLLYIKGKGYLLNNELNTEEGSFSEYVLRINECEKIGNVTTDLIKLTDDGFGG
jgi:hypothetical protein